MKNIKYKVRIKSGYLDEYVFEYGTIEEANDLVETVLNNLVAPENAVVTIEPYVVETICADSEEVAV